MTPYNNGNIDSNRPSESPQCENRPSVRRNVGAFIDEGLLSQPTMALSIPSNMSANEMLHRPPIQRASNTISSQHEIIKSPTRWSFGGYEETKKKVDKSERPLPYVTTRKSLNFSVSALTLNFDETTLEQDDPIEEETNKQHNNYDRTDKSILRGMVDHHSFSRRESVESKPGRQVSRMAPKLPRRRSTVTKESDNMAFQMMSFSTFLDDFNENDYVSDDTDDSEEEEK
jgi:hypothetical protein